MWWGGAGHSGRFQQESAIFPNADLPFSLSAPGPLPWPQFPSGFPQHFPMALLLAEVEAPETPPLAPQGKAPTPPHTSGCNDGPQGAHKTVPRGPEEHRGPSEADRGSLLEDGMLN